MLRCQKISVEHVNINRIQINKEAKNTSIIPHSSIKYHPTSTDFKLYLLTLWHTQWQLQLSNKLLPTKPLQTFTPSSSWANRREEILLARLHIGHTVLTLSHLFSQNCSFCKSSSVSIQHSLTHWHSTLQIRIDLALPVTLSELLGGDSHHLSSLFPSFSKSQNQPLFCNLLFLYYVYNILMGSSQLPWSSNAFKKNCRFHLFDSKKDK